jgi:hypothetical protein
MCKDNVRANGRDDGSVSFVKLDPDHQGELLVKIRNLAQEAIDAANQEMSAWDSVSRHKIDDIVQLWKLFCKVIDNQVTHEDLEVIDCL